MKIIDLLNMIAEGKEIPKKIKWGEHYLEWFVYEYKALKELGQPMLSELVGYGARGINDTVEIIEEENKILKEQQQELERYKNIVDELEKWLEDNIEYGDDDYYDMKSAGVELALNKLKELKGE